LFGELKTKLLKTDLIGLNLVFKDIKLAGSITEGSFSARLFEDDPDFPNDRLHRQYETDLEFTMFEFNPEFRPYFQDVPQKPGFLRIHIGDGTNVPRAVTRFFDHATPTRLSSLVDPFSGHLLSNKIKKKYASEMNFDENHLYVDVAKLITSFLTYVPVTDISTSHVTAEATKATSTFAFNILLRDKISLKVSSDFAFMLRCNWSPNLYETLRQRWSSTWLASLNLTSELQTAYIIAKPSNEERDNDNSTEFRYSFAHLERKLISFRTIQQQEIYLIFKSLFYRWVKPLDPVRLSSFICKCTMLWLVEAYPPNDPVWVTSGSSKQTALSLLLRKLYSYFIKGYMPYYFIPSINILQRIPMEVTEQVSRILSHIQRNFRLFLPSDRVQLIRGYLWNTRSSLLAIHSILNKFKQGDGLFLLYLERPNLANLASDFTATRMLVHDERKAKNVCNVGHVTGDVTRYLLHQQEQTKLICDLKDESLRRHIFTEEF